MNKKGLMSQLVIEVEEPLTAKSNKSNRDVVAAEWNLGPEKASYNLTDNGEYWKKMAKIWMVEEKQARRQLCANCEYFDNSTLAMEKMEAVPFDKFDVDGGGRGYCEKFDFICHNLRTCQAWEEND